MDESMGRRTATGIIFSRGGCSITFREQNYQDKSIRYCSRLGCGASLQSMKGTQAGDQEKASFHSGSSMSFCAGGFRKPQLEQRSRKSNQETDVAESSNRGGDSDKNKCSSRSLDIKDSDSNRRPGKKEMSHSVPVSPLVESTKLRRFSENATRELGSCSTELSSRASKQVTRQTRFHYKENSSAYDSTSMALSHASQDMASGSEEYGLENPRQIATSSALLSGTNSTDSGVRRTDNHLRKRSFKWGSSSSRGKSMIRSSNGINLGTSNTGTSGLRLTLPVHVISHQARRWSRNQSASMGVGSVRTRGAPSADTRLRLLGQVDDPILVSNAVNVTQQLQGKSGVPQSSLLSSVDFHPFCQNRHGQPESSTQIVPSRPIYEPAANGIRIFDASLEDRDGYPHLNMEGVEEVLLALERIEQDEGLTYQQLSVLGNRLFLDSLNFHDQYRDMRMDIDNMSYEELLALEEKMGTVSTALTEEALSRCLKRSRYIPASLISGISGLDESDVKCSICQDEFVNRDELGKLVCEHTYHLTCIHQWLRLKNWCPICKASVSSSS